MIDIDDCNSLNDIARKILGKANYTNREKIKQLLAQNGINWEKWLISKAQGKKMYCLNCGKELKRGQFKFCSLSCSATYNNKQRQPKIGAVKSINKKVVKEKRFCAFCGKELNSYQDKYCSRECQKEGNFQENIRKWKEGYTDGRKGQYGISNYIRKYLLKKNGCKCEICGWGERNKFTGNIPLEVHHIDGNYMNNNENNLQLLCPNCHSLTETFKNHNKNGRKGRNK